MNRFQSAIWTNPEEGSTIDLDAVIAVAQGEENDVAVCEVHTATREYEFNGKSAHLFMDAYNRRKLWRDAQELLESVHLEICTPDASVADVYAAIYVPPGYEVR